MRSNVRSILINPFSTGPSVHKVDRCSRFLFLGFVLGILTLTAPSPARAQWEILQKLKFLGKATGQISTAVTLSELIPYGYGNLSGDSVSGHQFEALAENIRLKNLDYQDRLWGRYPLDREFLEKANSSILKATETLSQRCLSQKNIFITKNLTLDTSGCEHLSFRESIFISKTFFSRVYCVNSQHDEVDCFSPEAKKPVWEISADLIHKKNPVTSIAREVLRLASTQKTKIREHLQKIQEELKPWYSNDDYHYKAAALDVLLSKLGFTETEPSASSASFAQQNEALIKRIQGRKDYLAEINWQTLQYSYREVDSFLANDPMTGEEIFVRRTIPCRNSDLLERLYFNLAACQKISFKNLIQSVLPNLQSTAGAFENSLKKPTLGQAATVLIAGTAYVYLQAKIAKKLMIFKPLARYAPAAAKIKPLRIIMMGTELYKTWMRKIPLLRHIFAPSKSLIVHTGILVAEGIALTTITFPDLIKNSFLAMVPQNSSAFEDLRESRLEFALRQQRNYDEKNIRASERSEILDATGRPVLYSGPTLQKGEYLVQLRNALGTAKIGMEDPKLASPVQEVMDQIDRILSSDDPEQGFFFEVFKGAQNN